MAFVLAESETMTAVPRPVEESIVIAGQTASIHWRRSARARRVALKIDPKVGSIIITLPPRGSRRAGLALLRGHENWVAERLAALPAATAIMAGGTIPINGEPYLIVHDPLHRGATKIEASTVVVSGQVEFLMRRVRDAVQALAVEEFTIRGTATAKRIGATPCRIRVKDTKSRWGSCTAEGTLMFSWRLIMAPRFVQDYVIAHEVAHLRHMNHGPAFWSLTDQLTPHRMAATTWLTLSGPGLLRIA